MYAELVGEIKHIMKSIADEHSGTDTSRVAAEDKYPVEVIWNDEQTLLSVNYV